MKLRSFMVKLSQKSEQYTAGGYVACIFQQNFKCKLFGRANALDVFERVALSVNKFDLMLT